MGHLRYTTSDKEGLQFVHPFLRRNNWRAKNLALCGNFHITNMDKVFKDAMQYLNDVEEMPISLGLFDGTIGKGTIKIHIPDNMLMRIMFGDNAALVLGESDFLALKELIDG
jgi:hypothetical protein